MAPDLQIKIEKEIAYCLVTVDREIQEDALLEKNIENCDETFFRSNWTTEIIGILR